jgi:hypothetical protein
MSAQQQSRFVLRVLLARASASFDISRLVLPVVAGLLMTGCNMILWGNLGVLAVAVGIFLETVFLSRSTAASRSASRSLSPTSSGAGTNSAADGTRS